MSTPRPSWPRRPRPETAPQAQEQKAGPAEAITSAQRRPSWPAMEEKAAPEAAARAAAAVAVAALVTGRRQTQSAGAWTEASRAGARSRAALLAEELGAATEPVKQKVMGLAVHPHKAASIPNPRALLGPPARYRRASRRAEPSGRGSVRAAPRADAASGGARRPGHPDRRRRCWYFRRRCRWRYLNVHCQGRRWRYLHCRDRRQGLTCRRRDAAQGRRAR